MTDVTHILTLQITKHTKIDRPEDEIRFRSDEEIAKNLKEHYGFDKVDVLQKKLFVMEMDDDAKA